MREEVVMPRWVGVAEGIGREGRGMDVHFSEEYNEITHICFILKNILGIDVWTFR